MVGDRYTNNCKNLGIRMKKNIKKLPSGLRKLKENL